MAVHQQTLGIPKRRLKPEESSFAKYDVLDLRYGDGSPAVLRHIDGSGFAYYPSGKKAICISACGLDASRSLCKRFGAVLHDDASRSPVIGVFDEWGMGYADGVKVNPGDSQRPKVMIQDRKLIKIDGNGKATEYVTRGKGGSVASLAASLGSTAGGAAEVTMKLSQQITLKHQMGRTTLDFNSDGVSHQFILGELLGDEVSGMPKPQSPSMPADAAKKLDEANTKLGGICDLYSSFKVHPDQRDTKPNMTINTSTATLKDLMEGLDNLRSSMTHPNLAKIEHSTKKWGTQSLDHAEWSTDLGLKKALSKAHPQCPGVLRKNWSIERAGGKYTEERGAKCLSTVVVPKTVQQISQLMLKSIVDEISGKGTLLVVICLATYAKEQSEYARLTAEKAQTELARRMGNEALESVRFVLIELSECAGFCDQYNIREHPPFYMMFRGGNPVQQHSEDAQSTIAKRLPGIRIRLHSESLSRPQMLLVEPNPTYQHKLERAIRRAGYSSDLALDGSHALRLASRQQVYGVLIVSACLRADVARSIVSAVRRMEPNAMVIAYNATTASDEDQDTRMRFLEECNHCFPAVPSQTNLQTVLARCTVGHPTFGHGCKHKNDFCDEIQAVLEHGRGQTTLWGTGALTLLPADLAAAS